MPNTSPVCRRDRGTVTQAQASVGVHCRAPGHSYADLTFLLIEQVKSKNNMVRKVRESYLIMKFEMVRNGLNKKNQC